MNDESPPWLSVLLPVFDVGPALDECLAALVDQCPPGVELVLVDDASSPADVACLKAWRERRPDLVRVIRHERNQGVSAARNTLLDAARGTWLWFVDPDDIVEPGALAALSGLLHDRRPDLVMCDFRTFSDTRVPPSGVPDASVRRPHVGTFEGRSDVLSEGRESLVAGLFRTGQLHPWTKIVRRAAWPATLRFPVGRVFEDLAVFPRVALAVDTFIHVPQVWISYRQRAGSALSVLDEKKLDDWTWALTGFARDLEAASLRDDAEMLFEVSHFCARTLLRALRRHARLPSRVDAARTRRVFAERWRQSSPLGEEALGRAYFERRMFGRWAQWRWTMWRLRGEAAGARAA